MKKNKMGFTIIELVVVIWLITLMLFIWASTTFNKQWDKQKLLTFSNDIFLNIEKIRNNALFWKSILEWWVLKTPSTWKINVQSGTTINAFYSNWWSFLYYWDLKVIFPDRFAKVSKISCFNIKRNSVPDIKTNIDIIIKWAEMSLSGCTSSPNDKILEIENSYKNLKRVIRINSVTWLIEKID